MNHRIPRTIKVACILTLVSLGLISWAIVHPVPLAVIAAMSVGQGVGTLAVLLFGLVALRDLKPIFRRRSSGPMGPESIRPEARGVVSAQSDSAKSEPPRSGPAESVPPESEPPESEPPGAAS